MSLQFMTTWLRLAKCAQVQFVELVNKNKKTNHFPSIVAHKTTTTTTKVCEQLRGSVELMNLWKKFFTWIGDGITELKFAIITWAMTIGFLKLFTFRIGEMPSKKDSVAHI